MTTPPTSSLTPLRRIIPFRLLSNPTDHSCSQPTQVNPTIHLASCPTNIRRAETTRKHVISYPTSQVGTEPAQNRQSPSYPHVHTSTRQFPSYPLASMRDLPTRFPSHPPDGSTHLYPIPTCRTGTAHASSTRHVRPIHSTSDYPSREPLDSTPSTPQVRPAPTSQA